MSAFETFNNTTRERLVSGTFWAFRIDRFSHCRIHPLGHLRSFAELIVRENSILSNLHGDSVSISSRHFGNYSTRRTCAGFTRAVNRTWLATATHAISVVIKRLITKGVSDKGTRSTNMFR